MATAAVCVIVRIFHAMGKHGYLFIIITCIYCITPGSALYRMILAFFHFEWADFIFQLFLQRKSMPWLLAGYGSGHTHTGFYYKIKGKRRKIYIKRRAASPPFKLCFIKSYGKIIL